MTAHEGTNHEAIVGAVRQAAQEERGRREALWARKGMDDLACVIAERRRSAAKASQDIREEAQSAAELVEAAYLLAGCAPGEAKASSARFLRVANGVAERMQEVAVLAGALDRHVRMAADAVATAHCRRESTGPTLDV